MRCTCPVYYTDPASGEAAAPALIQQEQCSTGPNGPNGCIRTCQGRGSSPNRCETRPVIKALVQRTPRRIAVSATPSTTPCAVVTLGRWSRWEPAGGSAANLCARQCSRGRPTVRRDSADPQGRL